MRSLPGPQWAHELFAVTAYVASGLHVAVFTWEAYTGTKGSIDGVPLVDPGTGKPWLNQTGPGQKNDPAKVPAKPPTGAKQEYRSRSGQTLPYPPNSVLLGPNGQSNTVSWLKSHGWNRQQIGHYLRSLLLTPPPGY